ncbi:hypothetical protein [Enterococcus mundtii]|uniref:hypothetical protein n=1 Tax=Enterococcus mundtii TaxID=53346 RepID=UPI001A9699E6|nr:hypothetical protein [Enterococcus mundtii]MBO1087166.1 hypothetical protein [Enterococcus mundtii]
MEKNTFVKELNLGWYVEKMVGENYDFYSPLLTRNKMRDSVILTSVTREKFFAENECALLGNKIFNDEISSDETYHLCEAVFAEGIGNKKIAEAILLKIKKECSGLTDTEISGFLKKQCKHLDKSTYRQLLTMPFYKEE